MKKSIVSALLLACTGALALPVHQALLTASAGTTGLYVQDGLIACWDGIENAGAGVHDSSAMVWKDLVAGYEFSLTGVTVDADRMTFAGTATSYGTLSGSDTTATFVAAKNGTMEIVYASRNSAPSQVLLQSTSGSGLAFGYSSKGNIIPSTINSSLFPYTLDTATNSVSIRYSAGIPVSPIYQNGSSLAASSSKDYWGSPNSATTFIGNRASKATGFPGSIYCIRLYNRQLTDAEIAANHALDVKRFQEGNHFDDVLEISGEPDGIGSPSPAYGSRSGLSAGDPVAVSCGATIVTDATETTRYSCMGWKLYDETNEVVSSGTETSFTYVHPTPAAYRRLEWLWETRCPLGLGDLSVVTNGGDHIVFSTDVSGIGYTAPSATLKFAYGVLPNEFVWTNAVNSAITSIGTVEATLPRLTPGAFYYIKAILETNDQAKDAVETDVVAIRTAPYDGDPSSWQDATAPIITGVTLDGAGSDTLVVSGNLASFLGDSCTLRVLVGPSPETMTNVWADLAGATLAAPGAFSLTLHESDMESVRYLAPYSTYCVAVVATASNGKVSTTPVLSVTMSPKSCWTYVEESVDHNRHGHGYVTDGVWRLSATRTRDTTQLTLTGSGGKFYGAAPSPMNFTNVRDAGGVAYQVVEFGSVTRRNVGQLLYDQGPMVTELVAPDCLRFNTDYNFGHCTSMTNVVLNANFSVLREGAFSGCASLRTIHPRRMMCTTVPGRSFNGCASLEGGLEFPVATGTGGYAFSGCSSLESVIATNLTSIGEYGFSGCTSLSEIAVSPGLTQVSLSGFEGCTALAPDSLGKILGKSLKYLGYTNFAKMGSEFHLCSSLEGPLVWDFPNLATNVVNATCFAGCSSLGSVIFKTPVAEIRDNAFYGIKEGGEIHMHAQAPARFGARVAGSQTAPYPRIYLKDNFDAWLTAMNVQQDLMRRADFDNQSWTSKVRADTIKWSDMAKEMAKDTSLCSVEMSGNTITKVNVNKKVLGIMLYCHNHAHWMCWILREPVKGTTIFVR